MFIRLLLWIVASHLCLSAVRSVPPYKQGPSSQYNYFLSAEQRDRGIGYVGSAQRLKAVIRKLISGQNVTVTTVGGSVTAGFYGAGDGLPWPDYLFNFLNDAFPGQVLGHNGAVPGTISSYMAACINVHVPRHSDLVLVEYSVNDPLKTHPLFNNEYRRAFERLLRKLLAYPHNPAVLLMHSYNWHADPTGHFWTNAEREYVEFAYYYDLPSLSVKASSFHEMIADVEGFSVKDFRLHDEDKLAGTSFFYDKVHPDHLTGSRAMAELAFHLMLKVKWELEASATHQLPAGSADSRSGTYDVLTALPPPMIPGNYQTLSDKCFIGGRLIETGTSILPVPFILPGTLLQGTIVEAKGFEWLNDSKTKAPKFGYIATQPGSTLSMKLDTSIAEGALPHDAHAANTSEAELEGDDDAESGSQDQRREDARSTRHLAEAKGLKDKVLVQVAHVKSYEGMGSASMTCTSGCECPASTIEGHQPTVHNSQLYLHSVYVSQSKECVLTISVNAATESSQKQTKVKIAGVIISEEAGEQKGAEKNVHHVNQVHTNVMRSGGAVYDAHAGL